MPALLPLSAVLAASVSSFTPESFHLMKVKAVYSGSDAAPDAQYILLQMYAPGQNFVAGKQVVVSDTMGTTISTFTFPADLPIGVDQSTILIATTQAQAFFGPGGPLAADLAMPPVLQRLAGKVCFHDPLGLGDLDCVAWGGYSGDPAGVGAPFNAPVGLKRG